MVRQFQVECWGRKVGLCHEEFLRDTELILTIGVVSPGNTSNHNPFSACCLDHIGGSFSVHWFEKRKWGKRKVFPHSPAGWLSLVLVSEARFRERKGEEKNIAAKASWDPGSELVGHPFRHILLTKTSHRLAEIQGMGRGAKSGRTGHESREAINEGHQCNKPASPGFKWLLFESKTQTLVSLLD